MTKDTLLQTIQNDTASAIAQGEGSVFSPMVHLMAQLGRRNASEVERRCLAHLLDAVESNEAKDEDELRERLSEEIDSIFTYTLNASAYLFGCDNQDAYEEECGEKAPSVEAQAAYALEQNVTQRQEWDDMVSRLDAL